ncbi:hypothetical protein [Nocardia miyunensis]|uniref:hypothetical protein n=1 Tax=Nocardia miyunensis TaxID=282684 RepID=UPI00082CAEBE|nr:hypothetical protein [Nocardia miyunensis]
MNYIVNTDKLSLDAIDRFVDPLGPVAEEVAVSNIEILEARGEARGRAQMLLELLAARFGSLDPSVERVVRQADVAQLKVWASRMLTATTVDEVLC